MDAPCAFRLLAAAAVLLSSAALAQPDPLSALLDCASIEDDGRRLECFDDAAKEALERGEARYADADRETRAAGLSDDAAIVLGTRPRGPRAAEDRSPPPDEWIVTIVRVLTNIPGRAVFITSDGAELVQTSGSTRLYLPDVPFEATLRRGAVGGLFLVPAESRAGIRVSLRNRADR